MDMTHDALRTGIDASEVVHGTIADGHYFKCDGNAAEVLERAREAIAIVSDATRDGPCRCGDRSVRPWSTCRVLVAVRGGGSKGVRQRQRCCRPLRRQRAVASKPFEGASHLDDKGLLEVRRG